MTPQARANNPTVHGDRTAGDVEADEGGEAVIRRRYNRHGYGSSPNYDSSVSIPISRFGAPVTLSAVDAMPVAFRYRGAAGSVEI